MTMAEVRKALGGEPDHVARQLLYQRTREHWLYQNPQPTCLVFDWQRGQAPRVTAILSSSPAPGS
jgi:hypothetical protein